VATIEQSIEVGVPVETAYNQWTQFEEFPRFMDKVKEVRQLDDAHLRWVAEVAGRKHEWDAEIVEQRPNERIAWRATGEAPNGGVVTFHRLDEDTTRVMLQMEYEPQGATEKAGSALGVDSRSVKGDLERFKEMIEARGRETGAWRGEIDHGSVSR
jgi:uncharacterized membrane protein